MTFSRRLLICALFVLGLSSPPASRPGHAQDFKCEWDFARFASKKVLRSMDPADRQAVESVLIQIFRNPDQEPSAAAKVWIREYQLESAVEILRKEGKAVQTQLKRQALSRKAAIALGSSLVSGILGNRIYSTLKRSLTPEQALNDEFGLSLQGNNPEELAFLEGILRCNPKRSDPLPISVRDRVKKVASARRIATFLLTGEEVLSLSYNSITLDKAYQDALYLWLSKKFALCTRWGTPSAYYFEADEIAAYRSLIEKLPFGLLGFGKDAINGIVRVHPDYQPPSARHIGQEVAANYNSATQKIEVFSPYFSLKSAGTIIHEIGHHIDHLNGSPSTMPKFWSLCANPPNGWYPFQSEWGTEPYAKTGGLAECFAEGVECFLTNRGFCRETMKSKHPEMHRYFEELLRIRE